MQEQADIIDRLPTLQTSKRSCVKVTVWAFAGAMVMHAVGAPCATENYDFGALEARVGEEIRRNNVPSISVSVARNGQVIYERAFGYSDLERRIRATPETAYRVGSVSKPFTATAVMVLRQRGAVDIDAPVGPYMSGLQFQRGVGVDAPVTLREILNHSSGLAPYFQYVLGNPHAISTSFEAAFTKHGLLVNPPRVLMEYSNTGYGLLGYVISRVTHKPYARAMRDEVFAPLGMNHTFIGSPHETGPLIAKGYDRALKPLPDLYNDTPAAGNAYSSSHDLTRFGMFHLDPVNGRHAILSKASVDLMNTYADPQTFYPYFDGTHYALGWFVRENESGYKTVWHEGGMPGASAIIKMLPTEHVVVSVVTNVSDQNAFVDSIANEALEAIVHGFAAQPLQMTEHYRVYENDPDFSGRWVGKIYVGSQALPCSLLFGTNGVIRITYGSNVAETQQTEAIVRGLVYDNSFLAAFDGILPSPDLIATPPSKLVMQLFRHNETLQGRVSAYTTASNSLQYFYPYFIHLERTRSLPECSCGANTGLKESGCVAAQISCPPTTLQQRSVDILPTALTDAK
jgi:CubicO group peptidase (beta-lactamase class C family)